MLQRHVHLLTVELTITKFLALRTGTCTSAVHKLCRKMLFLHRALPIALHIVFDTGTVNPPFLLPGPKLYPYPIFAKRVPARVGRVAAAY